MSRNFMQSLCPRCGGDRRRDHNNGVCPMTDEMWNYLKAYRKANGPRWKSKLTTAWADNPMSVGSILIQVRNIIGPTRLYKLKFPKEVH